MLIEVSRSALIPAPPGRVWTLLRDFNAMPEWNSTARSSRIEAGPGDRIGCRRIVTFDDGSVWTHELTALSDPEMSISYAIVDGPPEKRASMRDYAATISVASADGGGSRVTWHARFTGDTEAMRTRAEAVLEAGLAGIRRRLGV